MPERKKPKAVSSRQWGSVLMADTKELEDQLSWALSRISELEELLEEAYLIHRQMVAGGPVEWWA
ncbi:MAG: hypothetical protein HPY61_09360 [Methanotrichaceae archaeon]|nr:hypothetical protein [Methanotrichaceae archaeon]